MGDLNLQKAGILLAQNNFKEAEKLLKRFLSEYPTHSAALVLLSICYRELGILGKAKQVALKSLEYDPTQDTALYNLSLISWQENKFEKARAYIDSALKLNPEQEDYYAISGILYFLNQKSRQAKEAIDQGLLINPHAHSCLSAKELILSENLKFKEAEKLILEILNRDPTDQYAHVRAGEIALKNGNPLKAQEHFKTAIQVNPNDEDVRDLYLEATLSRFSLYALLNSKIFIFNSLDYVARWIIILWAIVSIYLIKTKPEEGSFWYLVSDYYAMSLFIHAFLYWIVRPPIKAFIAYRKWKQIEVSVKNYKIYSLLSVQSAWILMLFWYINKNFIFFSSSLFIVMMIFPLTLSFKEVGRTKAFLVGYVLVLYALGLFNLITSIMGIKINKLLTGLPVIGWLLFIVVLNLAEELEKRINKKS